MYKKTKRFGIDIDGTVTDPGTFLPYLNHHFNRNLTLQDISEYELANVLGIKKEEFDNWMKTNESIIYKEAILAPFVKDTLAAWEKLFDLYYISARPKMYDDITHHWFKTNEIPFEQIHLIGSHDKLSIIKQLELHAFFEDKYDNACNIAKECNIPVILISTPYNQGSTPSNVYRVNTWLEAQKQIMSLLG